MMRGFPWALPALALAWVAGGCAHAAPEPQESVVLAAPAGLDTVEELDILGVPDPEWRLRRLDGSTFSLGELQGNPVFVNLWATWCPPCVAELESIRRLQEELSEAGVHFVLVSPEDEAPVRAFLERERPQVEVVLEETLAPEAFGELVLPTTVILDRQGRMVLLHRGAAAWDSAPVVSLLRHLASEETS